MIDTVAIVFVSALCLLLLLGLYLILSSRPRAHWQDNHTIPPQKALQIAVAQIEGKPAIFHGGCNSCIWRHQNTTHLGIEFCRGCQYFAPNFNLPDKSINEYDLEKLN